MKIPKGYVGLIVTVKIVDPQKRRGHKKMEEWLARQCEYYLKILANPKVTEALLNEKR